MNLRNFEKVLAREEEVKKKAIVHKAVYSGPQIRYISKDGYSYLEFSNGASFESEISTTSTQYPQKLVCAVKGLLAKAIKRSNCFHASGGHLNSNPYMIMFGMVQITFSQILDFDQIWGSPLLLLSWPWNCQSC